MLLSCTFNYQEDDGLKSISIEQTHAVHHYNYNKPLESSLRILSMDENLIKTGHGSGNYFKIGGHHFIITAAHVLADSKFFFVKDGEDYVTLQTAYIDPDLDFAILVPRVKLHSVKPINYRVNDKHDLSGISVVYAGYPADLKKSIFNGMVSRCSTDNFIMQSFALPGASGSIVFDNNGRVLGVLSAIKVGYNALSPFPQLHPALVYVTRINRFSRKSIKELLVKWKTSK
tara:strand:- start:924 stop:1613 length:690 start_codon:yes stop_codon:yes gene_type:complete